MEDDLNFRVKWKTTSIFGLLEDDFTFMLNGRRTHFKGKWKMASPLGLMEGNPNFMVNGRQSQFSGKLSGLSSSSFS